MNNITEQIEEIEQINVPFDGEAAAAESEVSKETERVNVSLDVVWHGGAGKYDARISEISLDGCFIDSMGQEVLGETINFKVHLPSGPWTTLHGEVVAQEYPIGFDVRFINLTDDNRRLLVRLIAAHGGRQAQKQMREMESKVPAQPSPTRRRRILIADDDPMTLRMVSVIAETQGYETSAAADGREAFKILQQDNDFSAAIFDMKMPHLEGIDIIRHMRTEKRFMRIPVLLITSERDIHLVGKIFAAGATLFLMKPFTGAQLKSMLHMLLSQSATAVDVNNGAAISN